MICENLDVFDSSDLKLVIEKTAFSRWLLLQYVAWNIYFRVFDVPTIKMSSFF